MKRGLLYACCREQGYNKLVLAQHLDDLAESFIMSALHNGQWCRAWRRGPVYHVVLLFRLGREALRRDGPCRSLCLRACGRKDGVNPGCS
ncbi:unnamed protein product, partial [Ectocarpus sp. 8 AP-2014]